MPTSKTAKSRRVAVKKPRAAASKPIVVEEDYAQVVPLVLYRRIALTFVVLVAIALITVLYLSTMKAVIRVHAAPKEITTDFIVRTVETASTDGEVQGEVRAGTLQKSKTFTPSSDAQKQEEAIATGVVTISNTSSIPQSLVATTRLLTPGAVLFRLKKQVTVPANGSVQGEVVADKKGASGNIDPSSFTIPGLSEAKQKLITGKSTEKFTGGLKAITVLSKEEIAKATEELKAEMLEDAKAMLRVQRKGQYQGEAFFTDVREQNVSAKAGDQVTSFEVKLTVTTSGVFYDDEALKKIAERKLYEGLGQGQQFTDLGLETREVRVDQVHVEKKAASVHVIQTGKAVLAHANQALEVGRFVGMDAQEVEALLIKEKIATDVEVSFFPFWVHRVPRLKDHVTIEIK